MRVILPLYGGQIESGTQTLVFGSHRVLSHSEFARHDSPILFASTHVDVSKSHAVPSSQAPAHGSPSPAGRAHVLCDVGPIPNSHKVEMHSASDSHTSPSCCNGVHASQDGTDPVVSTSHVMASILAKHAATSPLL
jgi:hypothetical protein